MSHGIEYQIRTIVDVDIDMALDNLMQNLRRTSWRVAYTDSFMTIDEIEVHQLFGISSAFAGTNLSGLINQGAQYVPFFIKINSIDVQRAEVFIITGGSQSWSGKDYGRNRNIAEKLFDFCQRPPDPSVVANLGDTIKGLFGKAEKKKRS